MRTLITNAKIIDGSGRDAYMGDILFENDKIVKICENIQDQVDLQFDAKGKTVTPGFVDSHSHSDWNVLVSPTNELALFQGVTTVIAGQCGLSASPIGDQYAFWGISEDISNYYGHYQTHFTTIKDMNHVLKDKYNLEVELSSFSKFRNEVEKRGMSFNIVQLVGHNNLRAIVMGADCNRIASDEEIKAMCVLLEQQLLEGALGLSSGLDYYPGNACDTRELIELCHVIRKYDAIFTIHVRIVQQGYDGFPFKGEVNGILEAIEVAKKTGVKLHISHMLPNNYHTDDENPYFSRQDALVLRKIIDQANSEGLSISYDVMTGENGGHDNAYLISLIKPWIDLSQPIEKVIENLKNPEFVSHIVKEVSQAKYPELSMLWEPTLDDWLLISRCSNPEFEGKTIKQISKEMKCNHMEAICMVLKSDIHSGLYKRIGCVKSEFIKEIIQYDNSFPSCDGASYDVDRKTNDVFSIEQMMSLGPSWLCYNFAIRFIKEFGPSRLEDAIRRMTFAPCKQHGIYDRGLIKEGYYADLVILDELELAVNQDIRESKTSPNGIVAVFVNGELTVNEGVHTQAKAGKFAGR